MVRRPVGDKGFEITNFRSTADIEKLNNRLQVLEINLNDALDELNYLKHKIALIQDKSECEKASSERKIVELNDDLSSYIKRIHSLETLAILMAGKLGEISAGLNQPIGEDIIVDFVKSVHGKYVKAIVDAYYMERNGKTNVRFDGIKIE